MYIRKLKRQIICSLDEPIVTTNAGRLRGIISDDTYVFRGVQYATARRFHMPEPVESWDGVKEAIGYGFVCPEITTPVPRDQFPVPHYFNVQSEDCQNLNIWTQSMDPSAKKPVMVWFHGGRLVSGSGVEHYAYDGENLSKFGDVVVVTLNHRLNILGFLDLSAYGDEYKYSGNAGLADLVAALSWIKENIAQFGGDPDNVMIFGQSGGGSKVAAMFQTPAADGLFHKAALQSGGMHDTASYDPQMSKKITGYVLEYLRITPGEISKLETVLYDELSLAASYAAGRFLKDMGKPMSWFPVVNRDYYMGHPFDAGFRKEAAGIPVLCGTVLGEFQNNYLAPRGKGSKNRWSEEYKLEMIREAFGGICDDLIAAFKGAYPGKNIADVLFTDKMRREGSLKFAGMHSAFSKTGTYNYMFTLESAFNGGTIAWHNSEIPYVFHNADYLEASFIPEITEWLQDLVAGSWVSFARSGNPGHGTLPAWEPYTPERIPTMIFDREVRLGLAHDKKLMSLLPAAPSNPGGTVVSITRK